MITYLIGDATQPLGDGNKIICHICNDIGAWGAGFVLALSSKWKSPEKAYHGWSVEEDFVLGNVQLVQVTKDIYVANMIAQHGIGFDDGPPIRYLSLMRCLDKVAEFAKELNANIVMPRIGCGLAGGNWVDVGYIIEKCLNGLNVTVYDLKG